MLVEFSYVLNTCVDIMKMKFELYGYEISLWNLVVFFIVSDVMGWVVSEVINRD